MKVIPITLNLGGNPAVSGSCSEDSGEVPKLKLPLTRRSLLRGSGFLLGTLATGSLLSALAPSRAWAVELKTLNSAEGTTLMKMGRVLYPHSKLPDAVYALLAKDLDDAATKDSATAALMHTGIADLNKAAGGDFPKASAARQLAAVKSLEGTPFFAAVRGKCVTSLYDNDMAFAVFGYPGSSWEKGGYITRGFQDIKWLAEPTKEASPPPWFG
ncbi:tat (twin-arginine translocation) pathway signal sequence [Polaromonas sp.]|uniref:tat (twin-arginine translocation) pathway signal sequence n=1 Tax=Polaromonas sp. TaxID=1869339 RepID=UPI0025E109EE|nr:tat (twin-arginine translocation) pathway signal sequence [Polaromonas sp.]